jgi:Na+/proline symporter
MSPDVGIAVAAATVLVYTTVGGLLADAWTDLLQGIVLSIGLLVVAFLVVSAAGGPGAAFAQVEPAHWQWRAPGESTIEVLNRWAIPILGSITAQELISRVVACRTPEVARRAAWAASVFYLAIGILPVGLGLVASTMPLAVADPEHVLPTLAATHLPPLGYVLFVGALVSAILSTVDSCLLVSGSLISHNLVVPRLPSISEEGKLRAARIGVIGSGLAAWYLALASGSVLGLVEEASGFGSAGILVLVIFGLWGRFGGQAAALAALVGGVGVWIPAHFVYELPYDYLASVAAAFGGYLAVGTLERAKAPKAAPAG